MGIQERKLRDREALRKRIIAAATDLFQEKGYAAVSMRQIAKRVEYSVGTLYLYYKDKDELFLAVQNRAFEQAFAYMRTALDIPSPRERLTEMGKRYITFGIENPDLYRLMFMMQQPMRAVDERDGWGSGLQLHGLLTQLVRDCLDSGDLPSHDPNQISLMLWSMVHGMVSLKVSCRFDIYDHIDTPDQCPRLGHNLEDILQSYEMSLQMVFTPTQHTTDTHP